MMLLEHFSQGTQATVTGQSVGVEIETDFVDMVTGRPISVETNQAIFAAAAGHPADFVVQRELGRQKIELAIHPRGSGEELLDVSLKSLDWLYKLAAKHGAQPVFGPELDTSEQLLLATEPRDRLWVRLDGKVALEELCRCSSVQFTVDLNPHDAPRVLNALWAARLHEIDYAPNDRRWRKYIESSKFGYMSDRYAGPGTFMDLADYAGKLSRHVVAMHQGKPVRLNPEKTPELDTELYLRSVWWHYRLRRHGDTLTVEIRPFARRRDDSLKQYWDAIAPLVGR